MKIYIVSLFIFAGLIFAGLCYGMTGGTVPAFNLWSDMSMACGAVACFMLAGLVGALEH